MDLFFKDCNLYLFRNDKFGSSDIWIVFMKSAGISPTLSIYFPNYIILM